MTAGVHPRRVAVVTGGASGIGLALAERFTARGWSVAIADVDSEALERAAATLAPHGVPVVPVVTDVADAASVEALAVQARAKRTAVFDEPAPPARDAAALAAEWF